MNLHWGWVLSATEICMYKATFYIHAPKVIMCLPTVKYHIMAAASQEFHFVACLAYDIAFRKKAAIFQLSSWGHIDPQIYSKAFT